MNFEIGQKVVCVDVSGVTSLVEGATYTIIGINKCVCGCLQLLVHSGSTAECTKCACKTETPIIGGDSWQRSTRFRPLEYDSAHEEILEKYPLTEEIPDVPVKEPQKTEL